MRSCRFGTPCAGKTALVRRASDRSEYRLAWVALVLACVAGIVDAVGYLTLARLFTAHMSGNTAAIGAFLGTAHPAEALHRAMPIPFFVLGVALGAVVDEEARRRGICSAFTVALIVEAVLLAAFMLAGIAVGPALHPGRASYILVVALAPLAMGVQSASLQRVGRTGVRTTYISGMLTDFAEEGVKTLFWVRDRSAGHGARRLAACLRLAGRQESTIRMLLHGSIWVAFVVGAIAGGGLEARFGLWALVVPLGILLGLIARDLAKPMCAVPSGSTRRAHPAR